MKNLSLFPFFSKSDRLQCKDIIKLSNLDSTAAQNALQCLISNNFLCQAKINDSTTAIDLYMEEEKAALEDKGVALTATEIKKVTGLFFSRL